MDWQIDIAYLVVLFASIHMTYVITKQHWISGTLDWLQEDGKIDFDED